MHFSVPQGSTLGPIMFLLYVNSIFSILKNCSIFMFADDLIIIVSAKTLIEAQKIMQININHLASWAHDMKLIINSKKTKIMQIYNPYVSNCEVVRVKIHSIECMHNFLSDCNCDFIEQVSEHVYLGVKIDQEFSWNSHISDVISKIRRVIPQIYSLKIVIDEKMLRGIYYALVYPFLLYGVTTWGVLSSAAMTRLCKLQKRILKCMKREGQFDENVNVYHYWNILPVSALAKYVFLRENYFSYKGELRLHQYETRNMESEPLFIPRIVSRYDQRTLKYILPRVWNSLPLRLKNLQSASEVKIMLQNWFIQES